MKRTLCFPNLDYQGMRFKPVTTANYDDFHLIAVQISSHVQKMREAGKLKELFHLTYKLFLKILEKIVPGC